MGKTHLACLLIARTLIDGRPVLLELIEGADTPPTLVWFHMQGETQAAALAPETLASVPLLSHSPNNSDLALLI